MTMLDANTAALEQHMAAQDRAERNYRELRARAYQAALTKITRKQCWDAFWDDPAHALGKRFDDFIGAVDAGEADQAGNLLICAVELLRGDLVTPEMIGEEVARLAAEDRRRQ